MFGSVSHTCDLEFALTTAPDFRLVNGIAMNDIVEFPPKATPWFGQFEVDGAAQLSAFEPFVDERVIARFLQVKPRRVLEMARKKEIPAHAIGRTRKTWRFRISEIHAHFSLRGSKRPGTADSATGSGTQGRTQSWATVQ